MLLKVDGLTKKFGEQVAVNSVSFELDKGCITGFIGPNGSGKTTTMKMLTGILHPDKGNIFIKDQPLNYTKQQKSLFGYLPENNPLYYDMYVKEYLQFIANSHGIKANKSNVGHTIGLTGLVKEQNKQIGQLSKGYKQRVGLAQAIIHNPEILILDEPTTGLDPAQIVEIRALIQEIAKDKTVLLSTHLLQEVEAICHNILFIHNGNLLANNKIHDFKQNTSQGTLIEVEFKEQLDDGWVKSIDKDITYKKVNEYIWQLLLKSKTDIREQVFKFAKENNYSILSMQKKELSLEDTFQNMIK